MQWLRKVVDDPRTERVIIAIIIANAAVLGLEAIPAVASSYGPLLAAFDAAMLAVFVVELTARIVVRRLAFFRDPWSLFDFAVVAISLVPTTETFTVLRALRILRVLRLITAVPSLRRVVSGLISALPGMGSVVGLLLLLFYVFSVMATKLFGATFPQWFGDLWHSAYTLFQIMTLEGWSDGIVRPVMEQHAYAWVFFLPFIIITTFAVLNLFIGIVVNAMQAEHDKELAEKRQAEREIVHAETAPLSEDIRRLQAEIKELREDLLARMPRAMS